MQFPCHKIKSNLSFREPVSSDAGYQDKNFAHVLPESSIFTFIQAGEATVQTSYLTVGDCMEDSKDLLRFQVHCQH